MYTLGAEAGITPDKFVLLEIDGQVVILAGMYGGYYGGDEWRRSTPIVAVDTSKDPEGIIFVKTKSGSEYALREGSVGFTGMTSGIYMRLREQYPDENVLKLHAGEDVRKVLLSFPSY